eukprot:XP_011615692.1 PREDICTED: zinc finger and SCAN domain-containing protein 2-like [Takifugu rubripes]
MSPAAAFHAQLASIMEVLANTAVAEICELVDSGYSELQLEIARSRRENEQLRRKLRLMELRAARASALRALAGGARAPVPGHHGDHARRARAQRGEAAAASSAAAQERGSSGPPGASGPVRATPTAEAVAPTIKTEDGGASWSPSELNQEFCSVVAEETEAPPTSIKQEVSEESDGSRCASWMCDITSSCWSIQQTPNTDSVTTQNPLREEPGHSLALNATVGVSSDSGGGGLSLKEADPGWETGPGTGTGPWDGDGALGHRRLTSEAAAASSAAAQERGSSGPPGASGPVRATPTAEAVAPTIKTEDGGASWSPSELNQEFCSVVAEETEAPPTSIKQEVSEESDGSRCASWMCDITSSCWSIQQTPNTDSVTTQNPLREEPGHSLALNATVGVSSDSGGGGLSLKEAVAERQQGAPLPPDRPQLPARKAAADRPNASHRRERGRHQDGAGRGSGPGRGAGSSRAFVCNCCGKTLASLKNLNTHMRVHTGEKPFVCALCGKRFSDPSNLKRHQSVHTGEKRYGCVHCGKRFAQSGSLKVHMSVHTDCKQFRCSSCGKTFISGSHLRRHAAMHAAVHATERERPPPFSDH